MSDQTNKLAEVERKLDRIVRTCNRHSDCDRAENELLRRQSGKEANIPLSFHCYDDECEDCFGQ